MSRFPFFRLVKIKIPLKWVAIIAALVVISLLFYFRLHQPLKFSPAPLSLRRLRSVDSLGALYRSKELGWKIEDSEAGCPQKFYQIDLLKKIGGKRWQVRINQVELEWEVPCSDIRTPDRGIIKPYLLEEGDVLKLVIRKCGENYTATCGVANKWWLENKYQEYSGKKTSWLFPHFWSADIVYAEDCTKGGTECMVGGSCPTTRKKVPGCHPNPDKLQCVAGSSCADPWLDWKCCASASESTVPECADKPLSVYAYARKLSFVNNPSFEELKPGGDEGAIAGWENDDGERDDDWDGRRAIEGRYFVKGRKFHLYQRVDGLVPGKRYLVLVRQTGRKKDWGTCKEEASPEMRLSWDDDYKHAFLTDKSGGDRYWRTAEGEFTVPAGKTSVYIHLRGRHSNDTGWCKHMKSLFDWVEIFELCDTPEGCSGGGADGIILEVRVENGKRVEMQFSNDGGASWGMIADPQTGTITDGGWMPYGPLVYWSPADASCIADRFRDQRDDQHRVVQCDPLCFPSPHISGYVWSDNNNNGVRDAGEDLTSARQVRLAGPGVMCEDGDPLDPAGFNQRVPSGQSYRVCLSPSQCSCGTYWNTSSPPTESSAVRSYGSDPTGYLYADLGSVSGDETKYAYLGVLRAGFTISLPGNELVVDPDEDSKSIPLSVRTVNSCWEPSGKVDLSATVTSTNPSGDTAITVDKIEKPTLDPGDSGGVAETRLILNIAKRSSYAESYKLCVRGVGTPSCLGDAQSCVTLKVEHVAWFQSDAGDIYAASDITSRMPAAAVARAFRDEPTFTDLGPPYNYLSLAHASPGVVFSGGSLEWGGGTSSSEGWEVEGYKIGFFDSSARRYDYDYNYFEANFDSTCTLSGAARLAGGVLSDGMTSCRVSQHDIIKVSGNLEVADDSSLENQKAAILVEGDVTFDCDCTKGELAFISRGDVKIASTVENIRALILSNGTIYDYDPDTESESDWEDQVNGLLIRGTAVSLGYTGSSFDLRRTRRGADGLKDTVDDDFEAADYVRYDTELLQGLTTILGTARYTWEESE